MNEPFKCQSHIYGTRTRPSLYLQTMMTSSYGKIFRATGPLWGACIGDRWIPLTKARDAEFDVFLDRSMPAQTVEQTMGDLGRHRAHDDVTVSADVVEPDGTKPSTFTLTGDFNTFSPKFRWIPIHSPGWCLSIWQIRSRSSARAKTNLLNKSLCYTCASNMHETYHRIPIYFGRCHTQRYWFNYSRRIQPDGRHMIADKSNDIPLNINIQIIHNTFSIQYPLHDFAR